MTQISTVMYKIQIILQIEQVYTAKTSLITFQHTYLEINIIYAIILYNA